MKQKESRGNVKISIVALVRRTESLDPIPLVEESGVYSPSWVRQDLHIGTHFHILLCMFWQMGRGSR